MGEGLLGQGGKDLVGLPGLRHLFLEVELNLESLNQVAKSETQKGDTFDVGGEAMLGQALVDILVGWAAGCQLAWVDVDKGGWALSRQVAGGRGR